MGTQVADQQIETFKQYVRRRREEIATRHGVDMAEAKHELPESQFWAAWRDYVVKGFREGANIPTRVWRSMDEGLRYRVLRSDRALRDDALTAELRAKIAQ